MTTEMDLTGLLGDESRPIEFPAGLVGLEEWRRFVLIAHPAGEPLRLLQSLEDDRVALIVADPKLFVPHYKLTLSRADLQMLQVAEAAAAQPLPPNVEAYCIVSAQAEPLSVTVNLLGPLLINWQTGLGRQVVLSDASYSPRHPVTSPSSLEDKERA